MRRNPYDLESLKHSKYEKIKIPFSLHALIATWFFVGKSPIAPGTVGSLAAYPLYLMVVNSSRGVDHAAFWFLLLAVILTFVGTLAVAKFQRVTKTHDHQSVVIDEVVGMLVTLGIAFQSITEFAFLLAYKFGFDYKPIHLSFFVAFAVFRYFDIRKPFFIRTFDRYFKNPFGVILDDIVAALFSGATIYIILSLTKLFLPLLVA